MNILRPPRWSHSFLRLCADCPAAAQAKLRGEPSVAPANVRSGSDLHAAIAAYAVACWERGVTQDQEAAARIADGYQGSVRTNMLAFARDARWPWKKLQAANVTECPVEQMWEATLPNGETFVGRIDLAIVEQGGAKDNPFAEGDDTARIADWKSGRPAAWNDPDPPDQLLEYALLYRYAHPEQQDFELLYGCPGWSGQWAFKAWQAGRTELDRHERQLVGRIDRYLSDEEWAATPGEACAGCFFTAACPLNGTRTFEVLTNSSLDELAQAREWHAAKAKEATGYLKACEAANGGDIEIAGVPWGWNPKTSLRLVMDRDAADEYLRGKGHSFDELLGDPQKTKVARAIKDGWLPEDAVEEIVTGRDFGPKKTTPEDPARESETDGR